METHDYLQLVPIQSTGFEIEAEASIEITVGDPLALFSLAKDRLLNVKNWHKTAGIVSADFQIVEKDGNEPVRPIRKGDYMRVDIPGPGSKEGDGYDWVTAEELKEYQQGDVQSVGFRVRPVSNPLSEKDVIAHFYDEASTSSFIITREGKRITASIIDSNIKPNDEAASLTDKLRNTAVGVSAITSFSKIQWQKLADGLIAIVEDNEG